MAEGFRSREIAGRLSISELTVNTHRKNMLEKTGSRNATELIRLAMGFGLI
jgi:DNA-binding CsgD family transcriptional regulator